ncbi:DUF1054 family protein [Vagococcus sp.]|uniref:DUF1054 family protein n=1 Tax=Vagococcus sp. TaxID=1933889 RepID=UPI003F9AAF39
MFTETSFTVFEIKGLEERMMAIRAEIQPLFKSLDTYFVKELSLELGEPEFPIHIAQHRRRTTNAPDFTWSAMGGDARGYKKYPHFQLGITPDYLVLWLSFIDNPEFEQEMASFFLEEPEAFFKLPSDFVINGDHTKNEYVPLTEEKLELMLQRWLTVKKGEFQVGRVILKEELTHRTTKEWRSFMLATYRALVPFYQEAMKVRQKMLETV